MKDILSWAATLAFFFGVGILGWQGIEWLKSGHWQKATLMRFVGYEAMPHTSWAGINKLIYEAFNVHVSIFLIGGALLLIWPLIDREK